MEPALIVVDVFLVILWVLLALGVLTGTAILIIKLWWDPENYLAAAARTGIITLAGAAALAIIIGTPFAAGWVNIGDGSEHCGPGTTYQSSYDAATKTTNWDCEATR